MEKENIIENVTVNITKGLVTSPNPYKLDSRGDKLLDIVDRWSPMIQPLCDIFLGNFSDYSATLSGSQVVINSLKKDNNRNPIILDDSETTISFAKAFKPLFESSRNGVVIASAETIKNLILTSADLFLKKQKDKEALANEEIEGTDKDPTSIKRIWADLKPYRKFAVPLFLCVSGAAFVPATIITGVIMIIKELQDGRKRVADGIKKGIDDTKNEVLNNIKLNYPSLTAYIESNHETIEKEFVEAVSDEINNDKTVLNKIAIYAGKAKPERKEVLNQLVDRALLKCDSLTTQLDLYDIKSLLSPKNEIIINDSLLER